MKSPDHSENWTCVGVILGAHGLAGGLKIKSFCEVPRLIETYNPLKVEDYPETLTLKIVANLKDSFQATTLKIKDRNSAMRLKGKLLFAKRDNLPKTDEDEYYFTDLIGLSVKDTDRVVVGTVKNVANHGAGTFLEILIIGKLKTILVPFNKNSIPIVDISGQHLILKERPEFFLSEHN